MEEHVCAERLGKFELNGRLCAMMYDVQASTGKEEGVPNGKEWKAQILFHQV